MKRRKFFGRLAALLVWGMMLCLVTGILWKGVLSAAASAPSSVSSESIKEKENQIAKKKEPKRALVR